MPATAFVENGVLYGVIAQEINYTLFSMIALVERTFAYEPDNADMKAA